MLLPYVLFVFLYVGSFFFQEEDLFDIINRQKKCKAIYKDRETDIRKEKKLRREKRIVWRQTFSDNYFIY